MTAAEIRADAAKLVGRVEGDIADGVALDLIDTGVHLHVAMAIFEVAAQIAELNERLSNLTAWGSNGLALRVERSP